MVATLPLTGDAIFCGNLLIELPIVLTDTDGPNNVRRNKEDRCNVNASDVFMNSKRTRQLMTAAMSEQSEAKRTSERAA